MDNPQRSGEDQTAAATEYPGCAFDCPYPAAARVVHLHLSEFCDESLPFADMIADASRRAAAALKDARHWLSISEGNYRDMERQRDQITAEIASLKQQVIDSALRAERLEDDYERFQRSTAKELADRDAALIQLQLDRTALERIAGGIDSMADSQNTSMFDDFAKELRELAYRASLSPQPEDRT